MSTLHGGPDALGVPRWDFSINANACGPAPAAWRAVQAADATRYPDPGYRALRDALAALHGVEAHRIVLAGSASEFIVRLSVAIAHQAPGAAVHGPRPGYGDYAAAARAAGLVSAASPCQAVLIWHTQPGSPEGRSSPLPEGTPGALRVVDCAYAPLRLHGEAPPLPADAWTLWSPNKALGLTGVRGAYAVAPAAGLHDHALHRRLEALAPSWVLGAHAVAMLDAWAHRETQQWVRDSLATLRHWKAAQLAGCDALGWACEPSDTPFFVAHWPDAAPPPAQLLPRLRERGLKLRDAASLGRPGAVRVSVQPPAAQQALAVLWRELVPQAPAVEGRR
ncbi:aminotransferase class I/II-fold pyridoxal phosphate-dependent enzyme [Methylibium petroleiphilum]|uniref:aminotransferase class I/II-fold pyridoxal phosphate-dependent enzyme n=1 Tax=Methylibium petroleiphilum TaxID=105560 RepID=UPI003D298EF4